MAKYHVNDKGEAGLCRARKTCPFGDSEQHYPSKPAAQQAYELEQVESFGKKPDPTPRSNWRTLTSREEQAIYSSYRRVLSSIRATPTESSAAETKQEALKVTADRYKVPISQVKSIATDGMEAEGIAGIREDPKHIAQLAYVAEAQKLLANAKVTGAGDLICDCGSTDKVRVRTDPLEDEVYGNKQPMLSCSDCYMRVAEDI